jgi:hypothetical protein
MARARFSTRGFVREAEQTALELRAEVGAGLHDPLDPRVMAEHLAVPLLAVSDLDGCAGAEYFRGLRSSKFSAALVPVGLTKRVLLYHDGHAWVRRNSSMAHELGHLILGHACERVFLEDGDRQFNTEVENEASELGGWLLVTRRAGLEIARTAPAPAGYGPHAEHLGVSVRYLEWRLRVSGVLTQVSRERAKHQPGSTRA